MEMKWHPIINGNMEELNESAQYLFTVEIIQMDGNSRRLVTIGAPSDMSCMEFTHPDVREVEYKAWAEVPELYEPGRCDMCKHCRVWIDGFGDRWSKCELMDIATFVPLKCPLKK